MLLTSLKTSSYNLMTNNQPKNSIPNNEFDQNNELNNYQLLFDRLVRIKETIISLEKKFLVK